MYLPAIREKFNGFSARKRLLFIMLGVLSFFVILFLAEVFYCLNLKTCFFKLSSAFPTIGNLSGVQETDLAYRKGNFSLSKKGGDIFISGEIVKVEKDRLSIKYENGPEETYSVEEGSEFIITNSITSMNIAESEKYIFTGDNLPDFLSSGDFLAPSFFNNSKISSKRTESGQNISFSIIILRE